MFDTAMGVGAEIGGADGDDAGLARIFVIDKAPSRMASIQHRRDPPNKRWRKICINFIAYRNGARTTSAFRLPDQIQGNLKLAENARRGKEKSHHFDHSGGDPLARLAGTAYHQIYRLRAQIAHQSMRLLEDPGLCRFLSENQTGDGNEDNHEGRQRERGVIRQGHPQRGRLVFSPYKGRG